MHQVLFVMKTWLSILIICTFSVLACQDETQKSVSFVGPTPEEPSLDDLVFENCLIVQDAVEAYAIENDGQYPWYPVYTSPRGTRGFIYFLPDSTFLTNPTTGARTEPVLMEPSGIGSTSYRVFGVYDLNGKYTLSNVGYLIIGRGQERDITISNLPDSLMLRDDRVIENCLTVQVAVEAFAAENGGVYPLNMIDETPLGNTMKDFLPDGILLINPYSRLCVVKTFGTNLQ